MVALVVVEEVGWVQVVGAGLVGLVEEVGEEVREEVEA